VPKPTAKGRDLLVKIKAVSTNPVDFKKMANFGNTKEVIPAERAPLTVGWDAAGVVEQVGEGATLFSVGDEVYFAGDWTRPGAFADYTLVDERVVGKKPSSLTFSQAASLPLTGLTAWEALIDKLGISEDKKKNAGKTILIIGGAGGVSTAAIDLAKHVFGLTVIGTSSRPESAAYVKEMGADYIINHHKPLPPQVRALGFQEVDYIFHTAALSSTLVTEFIDLLKPFGGFASVDPNATVDLMPLMFKAISFHSVLMFVRPALHNEESFRQHEILSKMSALVDQRVISHREKKRLPFEYEHLKMALELQASGKCIGKITLSRE